MTVFIPLEASSRCPRSPPFLVPTPSHDTEVTKVIKAIMKAKRIVVVCGAGISVKAGIPDFRSSDGLFHTLKRDNPRELLSSGKDLFDASVFNSENSTSMFCQMIARLSELSTTAEPTPFHRVLRALDESGKLLRVYTQNIDAIESKSGMSLGVPVTKPRVKTKELYPPLELVRGICEFSSDSPPPNYETPRCIPLHGTLQKMHCQNCTYSFPLKDHLVSLTSGTPPDCPECLSMNDTRSLVGKRPLSVGKLRPSVVLYNEMHKDGEMVGEVVRRDLMGGSKGKGRSGADLLLVVGTSLRVPGTKRIVREFAKAVRSRSPPSSTKEYSPGSSSSSSPSPSRSPASDEEPPMKSIYLNLDFPVPTREWEGVFDAWLQGDAQTFARMLQDAVNQEQAAKEVIKEKKRKREEEAAIIALRGEEATKSKKKKGAVIPSVSQAPKRRKVNGPTTPSVKKKSKTTRHGASSGILKLMPEPPEVQPKIFLRIPSATTRKLLVPEVYITTSPPLSGKKMSLFAHPISAQTPCPGGKSNVDEPHTVMGSGDVPHIPIRSYLQRTTDESDDEYSELSDISDELPTPYVRSGPVQYSFPSG